MAFEAANRFWSIPFFLDPDDAVTDPDEVCVIIYLAFYHNFVR
jgi:hypothetical protein